MDRNVENKSLQLKIVCALLIFAGCLLCWMHDFAVPVQAADITLGGTPISGGTSVAGGQSAVDSNGFVFYYQIYGSASAGEVVISGYSYSGSTAKELVLPAYIQESGQTSPYKVVGINGSVFANCPYISGVTFGSTYQFVSAEAFMGCPLTSITFNHNGTLTSIKDRAFYRCKSLTSVTIPASVTSIGTGVFADCTSLNAITVVSGNQRYCAENGVLYTIGKDMLIQWPAALLVGSSTSGSCVIGSSTCPVRVIGDKAFEGCIYLSAITDMYSTVTTIGEQAFYNCSALNAVTIPSTVLSVGNQAFSGCSSALVISCDKNSAAETYAKNNNIATSVTCTVNFYDGTTLVKTERVQLGAAATAPTLTEKSGYTLTWDKEFTNVQQNLDVYASWKQNFTVTFQDPESGQVTEQTAYYGSSVTPPSWTRAGYTLGWDSSDYTYVKKNMTIHAVWLVSMTGQTITEEAPSLGDTRTINFITYQVIKTAQADPRVCAVGCTKQTIGTINLPARITFGGVSYKVTRIGRGAFRDMPKLASVTIGKNMIRIEKNAFYNCPKLKTIKINSRKITGIGEKAFSKTYVKAKVNVVNGKVKKYKKYLLDAGLSTYARVY